MPPHAPAAHSTHSAHSAHSNPSAFVRTDVTFALLLLVAAAVLWSAVEHVLRKQIDVPLLLALALAAAALLVRLPGDIAHRKTGLYALLLLMLTLASLVLVALPLV